MSGGPPRRVRFAPSPTGALHVGSMRTALFNWLAARSSGGAFVLRIEDTDQGRYVPGSEAQITESLRWLGLHWDEGPEVGGPHEPYVQSLRSDRYLAAAETLVAAGAAYWCDCTPERLAQMRERQRAAHEPSRYDRHCLPRQEEVSRARARGDRVVLRQRVPEGVTAWDDLIRGRIEIDNATVDDQVLLKGDGLPTYHLANVVDDHDMEISDVIRAEEWVPSTPKHLLLYAAFGWEPPRFAHVPVVLGEDRQKLSKRRGARSVLEYREMGYLPDAVVNAMALLGWSAGTDEEVFTPAELVERFSVERVNPAPAVFDAKRLDALNGVHIRRLDDTRLVEVLRPWVPGVDDALLRAAVPLLRERLPRLDAAAALLEPLQHAPDPAALALPPPGVTAEQAAAILDAAIAALETGGDAALADEEALVERLRTAVEAAGLKPRRGFPVVYVAILGSPQGLPVSGVMRLLGAEESLRRLRAARARLS